MEVSGKRENSPSISKQAMGKRPGVMDRNGTRKDKIGKRKLGKRDSP